MNGETSEADRQIADNSRQPYAPREPARRGGGEQHQADIQDERRGHVPRIRPPIAPLLNGRVARSVHAGPADHILENELVAGVGSQRELEAVRLVAMPLLGRREAEAVGELERMRSAVRREAGVSVGDQTLDDQPAAVVLLSLGDAAYLQVAGGRRSSWRRFLLSA